AVERLDRRGPAGAFVLHAAAGATEDGDELVLLILKTAGLRNVLSSDAAKERGKAPVVVLAPFLIRVMVALGAGHAQAEKYLGGVIHKLFGLLQLLVPHRRRVRVLVAVGGQNV